MFMRHIERTPTVEMIPCTKSKSILVEEKIQEQEDKQNDDAFFIGDLGDIINKYEVWMSAMPRVKPFYAVKCCDEIAVLKILADLGASFDCASKAEIEAILSLGIPESRIVYANPCKQISYIKYAARKDISQMTFDNEEELHKVKRLYPGAKLIIRILPSGNFKVNFNLGKKFGCSKEDAIHLLKTAKVLGLNVIGVSFHVGSGCLEPDAYTVAIQEARQVFDIGKDLGFTMTLLDIGGGFPGHKSASISFEEITAVIRDALDENFPADDNVEIIAEPGQYFITSAFTLVVNIIGKRTVVNQSYENGEDHMDYKQRIDERSIMYYVNNGMHGVFNLFNYGNICTVNPVVPQKQRNTKLYNCSIWGPTCHGGDHILQDVQLPDLKVGSWLYFENMGSYTLTVSSFFNGMPAPSVFYLCNRDIWYSLFTD